ncbi:MAG TPA: 2-C-methyl-D-erythritol 2,4-cyclodiphosphate synthase [bacterium]|nr:2-C-methyl-D-erythritol 2,4-cyclodiphosphate synthase [bacterium]
MDFRIGIGYDAHRFEAGRPLILGGVTIPHDKGLLGHSDADALCHAVSDAILGAAALGDMGKYFPDTDPKWKGADSLSMLAECARRAKEKGWKIGNVDATIVCQKPKLSGKLNGMAGKIAETLGVGVDQVNVKAKSTEGMGFEGREEGLSVQAIVLLQRS